jgi:hypothetical protein
MFHYKVDDCLASGENLNIIDGNADTVDAGVLIKVRWLVYTMTYRTKILAKE